MYSRITLKLKPSSISFTHEFYALGLMQQVVSRINRLTQEKMKFALKERDGSMFFLPFQRVDPVIQILIEASVQVDV